MVAQCQMIRSRCSLNKDCDGKSERKTFRHFVFHDVRLMTSGFFYCSFFKLSPLVSIVFHRNYNQFFMKTQHPLKLHPELHVEN